MHIRIYIEGEQKEKKIKLCSIIYIEWIFKIFHDATHNGTIELEITFSEIIVAALYDV